MRGYPNAGCRQVQMPARMVASARVVKECPMNGVLCEREAVSPGVSVQRKSVEIRVRSADAPVVSEGGGRPSSSAGCVVQQRAQADRLMIPDCTSRS